MKQEIIYKLVGVHEGFSCKRSLILKNQKSDLEINCAIDRANIIYDLISKEDIIYIKYLKNYICKNTQTKI